MHRQAMLVSLSLSPASTAAKNDRHWAFLEEIDAPQWADLKAEEALAKAGTIGDDPWFYRSHSHHEVPLTELTSAYAADIKELNATGNVRTPNLERKKNRGSSKAKLAFDSATAAKSNETAREDRLDESPRADYSSGCHDTFGDFPRIASPVQCKSPEKFLSARRFISSATSDDYEAGNEGTAVLGSSNLRVNMFENQYVNEQMNTEPDIPVSSTSSAEQSAGAPEGDDDRPSQPSLPWQDAIFPRLNDVSRLRKSLGSALRVKVDDSADNPSTKRQGAASLPKSRLVRQSVQLESAALPGVGVSERDTTFLKKDTASLRNENGVSNGNCESDWVRSGDDNSGTGLASKLGINSSVQAFDDIRRMRKSWGSALRVKVTEDPPIEALSSKHDISKGSPVSDAKEDCSSVKPNEMVVDLPSIVDMKAIKTGSEEKRLPVINLPSTVRANERRAHNPREALDLVKEPEVSSPKLVAGGAAKKLYRRSVSFDHTPGRGSDMKTFTSSRSNLVQQKQGSRSSAISRLNGPAEKSDKVSRLSKGGKENTSLQSSTKTTKLNPEPSVGSPRMGRQSVMRMSMPSLTFAAHARAAMGANGGGTILKPSGLNSVIETSRSDSSKAAASVVSAARKSAVGLDNGSRKKTAAHPAAVTNPPSKMVTRQSILRSSMPVFSASAAKQASKHMPENVTALKSGAKNGSKIGSGDADLAALLAEHNRKFRPKPKYEPRIHSVKDIREWEARTGQMFYNLLPAEREKANLEISTAKQNAAKIGAVLIRTSQLHA